MQRAEAGVSLPVAPDEAAELREIRELKELQNVLGSLTPKEPPPPPLGSVVVAPLKFVGALPAAHRNRLATVGKNKSLASFSVAPFNADDGFDYGTPGTLSSRCVLSRGSSTACLLVDTVAHMNSTKPQMTDRSSSSFLFASQDRGGRRAPPRSPGRRAVAVPRCLLRHLSQGGGCRGEGQAGGGVGGS